MIDVLDAVRVETLATLAAMGFNVNVIEAGTLDTAINQAIEYAENFTNWCREKFSLKLCKATALMAAALYVEFAALAGYTDSFPPSLANVESAPVSSLKEGDTAVAYAVSASKASVFNYAVREVIELLRLRAIDALGFFRKMRY